MKFKGILIFIFVPLIMWTLTMFFTMSKTDWQEYKKSMSGLLDLAKVAAPVEAEIKELKKEIAKTSTLITTAKTETAAQLLQEELSQKEEKIKALEAQYDKKETDSKVKFYFDKLFRVGEARSEQNAKRITIVGTLLLVLIGLLLPYGTTRKAVFASSLVVLFSTLPFFAPYIVALIILWITKRIYTEPGYSS